MHSKKYKNFSHCEHKKETRKKQEKKKWSEHEREAQFRISGPVI